LSKYHDAKEDNFREDFIGIFNKDLREFIDTNKSATGNESSMQ
jgi:hypothetical protein